MRLLLGQGRCGRSSLATVAAKHAGHGNAPRSHLLEEAEGPKSKLEVSTETMTRPSTNVAIRADGGMQGRRQAVSRLWRQEPSHTRSKGRA